MKSIQTLPPDVLVVGAGPVGLTSALSLLKEDIPLRVIDAASGPSRDSYASLLHPDTLALLDKLGVYQRLLPHGNLIESIGVYVDAQKVKTVDLRTQDSAYPHILALPQSALEATLIEELALGGVEIEWDHSLTDLNHQESEVSGKTKEPPPPNRRQADASATERVEREFHVPFLFGADGYRSQTREFIRTGFCDAKPSRSYEFFEFDVDGPLEKEMKLVFHHGKVSAFIPLSSTRGRWTFELDQASDFKINRHRPSSSTGVMQSDTHLNSEHFHALLAERAPFFDHELRKLHWQIEIHFAERLASSFSEGRVCLLGDAAHTTSPLGVHSLNCGIREGYDLSQTISTIQHGNCPISLLQSWSQRSHDQWRWLLGLSTKLTPLPNHESRFLPYSDQILSALPGAPERLPELCAQLGFEIAAREAAPFCVVS
jgi:NADPH-dependent dioxygenase|tara:strand:- start:163 stop:1452 length:1290 start_codon:yes stop_codon:yes gene_type:complete